MDEAQGMRALIVVEAYPTTDNLYAGAYVHTRVREYQRHGIGCAVLSFRAACDYAIDGIPVLTEAGAAVRLQDGCFDAVLCHAPNLRNHLRFIRRNAARVRRLVLFFHGHELLRTRRYYPRPYAFDHRAALKRFAQVAYDPLKLHTMRRVLPSLAERCEMRLVFVSEWMREESFACLSLPAEDRSSLERRSLVINNPVGSAFIDDHYAASPAPAADFITIRPFDNPKYAIDIVCRIARANPECSFHVHGTGRYFDAYPPPRNISIFPGFIAHGDMPGVLNRYQAALLPTRLDAQGVMMCELATFGIPLVTSDLPICREMLRGFPNVLFRSNDEAGGNLHAEVERLRGSTPTDEIRQRFGFAATTAREIKLVEELCRNAS